MRLLARRRAVLRSSAARTHQHAERVFGQAPSCCGTAATQRHALLLQQGRPQCRTNSSHLLVACDHPLPPGSELQGQHAGQQPSVAGSNGQAEDAPWARKLGSACQHAASAWLSGLARAAKGCCGLQYGPFQTPLMLHSFGLQVARTHAVVTWTGTGHHHGILHALLSSITPSRSPRRKARRRRTLMLPPNSRA